MSQPVLATTSNGDVVNVQTGEIIKRLSPYQTQVIKSVVRQRAPYGYVPRRGRKQYMKISPKTAAKRLLEALMIVGMISLLVIELVIFATN